jgi:hypothetical protein
MLTHNALPLRMIIEQLAPLLPKDNEEVNTQVKHLQVMLDQLSLRTRPLCVETKGEARFLTTARARKGTRPVASLHRWSVVGIGMGETCAMSFTTNMHATRLKTSGKSETASSVNGVTKGTMISMAPSMTSSTINVPQMEVEMKGGGVYWLLNLKLSGIEKYDGSTNPAEWLEVYQLAIKAARIDS